MKKPEDVHKIHRFRSFSERIQAVNVDVSRKIEKRSDVPEDEETFFEEGLLKWRDLDQTAHFTSFYSSVQGCAQTFAQLVHNKEAIVDLLLKHLQVENSMSLEALLDLVVQLARDLQKDFYPYFQRFFLVIAEVLNNYMKSWEVLEQAFTCLSYLFKFLWRKMILDMKQLFAMYQPFLSENTRDYTRRFAAESLSYLMRKVKDRTYLFNIMFSRLNKHPEMASGVGNLIFEMVKGPRNFFHSCADDTLTYLLQSVGDKGLLSVEFSAVQAAFALMAEHVDQANTHSLWAVLQKEVNESSARLSVSRLECVSTILLSMVDFKSGCLLPRPCTEWCNNTLIPLLAVLSSPDSSALLVTVVLGCVGSLLLCDKTSMQTESVVRLLSLIYDKQCVPHMEEIFKFTETLFQYSQFEKDVERRLLVFCNDCILQSAASEPPSGEFPLVSDSQSQVLAVLSKLILNKVPEKRDGIAGDFNHYRLTMMKNCIGIRPKKWKGDAINECLTKLLHNVDKAIEGDIEHLWAALILLPNYFPFKQGEVERMLCYSMQALFERMLFCEQYCEETAAVCSLSFQTFHWASKDETTQYPIWRLLEKYPECPHILRYGSLLYMRHTAITPDKLEISDEHFHSLYSSLKKNISSPKSQVRLLTLRILSYAESSRKITEQLKGMEPGAEPPPAVDNVFTLCLRSEEQEATLNNYREKLRLLRCLDYDLVKQYLPEDGIFDDVPLRYLSAVLYVNFSMLWPETLTLIQSHGKSLSKDKLWSSYGELLATASDNCYAVDVAQEDNEMECEEPSAMLEVFNQSVSFHRNDAEDRVDFGNHRELLWRAMHAFPKRCEQNSKAVVELFFQFLEKEYYLSAFYDAPSEDISKRGKEPGESVEAGEECEDDELQMQPKAGSTNPQKQKRTKIVYQTLITKLTLFSKFLHPMRVSQEPRLTKLYNNLLMNRDITVQQVALKCLMTYKKKHLVQYSENFERLLNDTTFRNELTMFSIDSETSVIKLEDRPTVMSVLIRILYGRMLHSTGKETKGRGGKGDLRRTIVLSFFAGCQEEELGILLDLITEPFAPLLAEDYIEALDLTKATPPRRVLGILSTIAMLMEKLAHLMGAQLCTRILHLLLSIIKYSAFLLDTKREEISFKSVNSLKVARQTAIKSLSQFMDRHTEYAFSQSEISTVFEVAVWPQLPRLAFEGTSAPTALLTLLETFTHYRRYLPLLLKLNTVTGDYPLNSVMKLLASPHCKLSVGSLIMELVGNILDFHTATSEVHMETDDKLTIPVGDVVEVNDSAGSYEVGMLIPHLFTIISYIKERVSKATLKGTNQTAFPMKELNILSLCSQYVDAPALCSALLTQLLPFLTAGSTRLSEEIQCGILKTLGNLALKSEDVSKHLCQLLVLCSSLTQRVTRMHLVKMFDSLSDVNKDCKEVADFVRDVNAFDRSRIEEPDYDSRLGSFREISWWDYEKCPLSLVVAIIHNSCFTLKYVDDMALRDSASAALQTLVKKMPLAYYDTAIYGHLAPLIRVGIQLKRDTIRTEFLAILRDMVNSRPDIYSDLIGLANADNIEDDFWENIRHIQISRRLKGLNRLMRHLEKVQMKNSTLTKYLLPLVFSFIKDETDYHKKNAMVDVCIATLGALCKHLPWSAYKSQLKISLNMLSKAENNKMAVRLICTILDSFHYDVGLSTYAETQVGKGLATDATEKRKKQAANEAIAVPDSERPKEIAISHEAVSVPEANQSNIVLDNDVDEGIDLDSETQETKSVDSLSSICTTVKCPPDLATSIHSHVIGSILPQLHQILSRKGTSDDLHKNNKSIHPEQEEIQRVPLAIAIVKLLQKISSATLERHLPSVLMKVCYFMKSRAEDIRDSARQTLAKILECLGPSYMSTITDNLKATLVRGYQTAILGYTLHYILNQNIKMLKPGDLTPCMHNLVYINMNGLFGSSGQDKDIDKVESSKEKRKPQYYELFGLLAKLATPSTIAVLLLPLKEKLDSIHKAKDMSKLRQCLDKMADGLLQNPGLTAEHYLKFTYGLVSDSVDQMLQDKKARQKVAYEARRAAKEKAHLAHDDTFIIPKEPGRSQPLAPTMKESNKHVLVEFGMKLFHMLVKKAKISFGNEDHARMVDPFVHHLVKAISSEHVPVILESLICLTFVIRFKALPSLVTGMDQVITSLFTLLQTYSGTSAGESFELCQLCFRLISVVLKTCNYYQWTEAKIEVLLSYAEADILDHNRQATAFSLLKAVISRKLLCKLLYEVIKKVEQLSVTSESSDVRLNCRQVVLQFLLDYPLGKSLPKHVNFYLNNLDYGAEHGRESIYEMIGALLTAFPQKTVHSFSSTLFMSLTQARANDKSEKCRKLASLAIKTLLSRIERTYRTKLFQMALKWLQESQVEIAQVAAHIIGIFVVIESDSFSSRFTEFLPVLEKSLQPQNYLTSEGESDSEKDLQLYHIILLITKVVRACPRVLRQKTCDIILEHVRRHMLHPHVWVRSATAQVFGLVFSTYNPDELVAAFLSSGKEKPTDSSNRESLTTAADANKLHLSMMFLLKDTRQKLRDFTADFCTQLSSAFMEQEFAEQIVKNLVFLARIIRRLPESQVSGSIPAAVGEEVPNPSDEDSRSTVSTSESPSPRPSPDIDTLLSLPLSKQATSSVDVVPTVSTEHSQEVTRRVVGAETEEGGETGEAGESVSVSIDWLIRRLGKAAMFEATNAPRETVKRANVFKCLAGIAMELGPDLLRVHLKNILPPIHRELTMVKLFPETEELRNLAGEVSNLLKSTVGVSVYSADYASVHQAATLRKADRKRKLAQQAVMNPSIAANKKMRIHAKKFTSKRHAQKQSKYKGSKISKNRKQIARDMAILQ